MGLERDKGTFHSRKGHIKLRSPIRYATEPITSIVVFCDQIFRHVSFQVINDYQGSNASELRSTAIHHLILD